MNDFKNKLLGGIFGHCIGDALGVPVEFKSREQLKRYPVKGMIDRGVHYQPEGTWSDDSSFTFCLMQSIVDCKGNINYSDIADKFVKCNREGYWTPYGTLFDIGFATEKALWNIEDGVDPILAGGTEEMDNGNGSLMRILPLAFMYGDDDYRRVRETCHISAITHGHIISRMSCDIYVQFANNLIRDYTKKEAFEYMCKDIIEDYSPMDKNEKQFNRILSHEILTCTEDEIKSTGYVVDTLEASIWAFFNSNSYREAVLKAVNLGGDTDTIGAITGGLAGIYYGFDDIPKDWVDILSRKNDIMKLCEDFMDVI